MVHGDKIRLDQSRCEAISQLDDSELIWALRSVVFSQPIEDHILHCSSCRARGQALNLIPAIDSSFPRRKSAVKELKTGADRIQIA
jgi:hypothetical protein